jgi:hypothetical protein
MKNLALIVLCFLSTFCVTQNARAAFVVVDAHCTNGIAQPAIPSATQTHTSISSRLHTPADYPAKPDAEAIGRIALTVAIVGALFWPIGFVAMYFGIKGWKIGAPGKWRAVTGFCLGVVESLLTIGLVLILFGV